MSCVFLATVAISFSTIVNDMDEDVDVDVSDASDGMAATTNALHVFL
jgi:hypothetical protein